MTNFDNQKSMRSKTITTFSNEIEKYYQKLSLLVDTNVSFINNECISGYLTIDMPKFYKMLLVEYINNLDSQYVNALIYSLYNLCRSYVLEVSKVNSHCSFKNWIYYNVNLLTSGHELGVCSLVYPFISHGILLNNLDDYDSMLSPQSSNYISYLLKKPGENYEKKDLDYLSQFSMRFISDIHSFDLLLRRVVGKGL
jgi:hypothetical protein